jgi:hypothetical protein
MIRLSCYLPDPTVTNGGSALTSEQAAAAVLKQIRHYVRHLHTKWTELVQSIAQRIHDLEDVNQVPIDNTVSPLEGFVGLHKAHCGFIALLASVANP